MRNGNAVMASEVSIETDPKKFSKTLNMSTISHTKVQNKNSLGNKKKFLWFPHAKHFLLAQIQAFLKSKAPMYLLSAVYLVICLLGNIVTGIILVKHHFASHDEVEGINNLTQDIFSQIEARNNETTAMIDDSESDFDLSQMEAENSLDQQLLYLNISNDTVIILFVRLVLVLKMVNVFPFYCLQTKFEQTFSQIKF